MLWKIENLIFAEMYREKRRKYFFYSAMYMAIGGTAELFLDARYGMLVGIGFALVLALFLANTKRRMAKGLFGAGPGDELEELNDWLASRGGQRVH